MTDAELQALWDKNMEVAPPKRLSRSEFFEKYKKPRKETVSGTQMALGAADWLGSVGSKVANMLVNLPEAAYDIGRGQAADPELAQRYGGELRDNTTERFIEETPILNTLLNYKPRTEVGRTLERGEEAVLNKVAGLGRWASNIGEQDRQIPLDPKTLERLPAPPYILGAQGSGRLGNIAAHTIRYGLPAAVLQKGIQAAPVASAALRKGVGSAEIQAAKGLQTVLPESDILAKAVERVGDNRFNTINLQLPMINDRRNMTMEFLGKEKHIPDWYGNALNKGFHAIDMALTALRQKDTAATALDGFTPNVVEALQHVLQKIEGKKTAVSAETGKPKKQQRVDYLGDIFHGQLGHILASLEKMEPHSPRTAQFRENFGEYLFPDNVRTLSSRLSATDIEAVMGQYLGGSLRTPDMIDAHILPFVKDMAVEPFVHLSSKPFHEIRQNISKMKERGGFKEDGSHATYPSNWRQNAFSFKGGLPLIHQVQRILKEQGESATKESIISELKKMDAEVLEQFNASHRAWEEARPDVGSLSFRSMGMPDKYGNLSTPLTYTRWRFAEPKRKSYGALELEKNIVDHGGYVSVQQPILSTDTLLATVTNRAIFDKAKPERAAVLNFDSYQLGTGQKAIDTAVTAGSDTTRIFFDWIPWKGKGKDVSPELHDMVVGGVQAGGSIIEQMRPLGFTEGAVEGVVTRGRPKVSQPIPITGGTLYQPAAKQMESMGLLNIPEYTKQLMREKSRMYE